MRIAVIGPGAMGLLLSASFKKAGLDVTLVDKNPDRARAITANGVEIIDGGKTERIQVAATAEPALFAPFDLAIVTVKAEDTENAAHSIAGFAAPNTWVMTMQNGIGSADILAGKIPPARVMVGVTALGATLVAPGVIRLGGKGATVAGPFIPSSPLMPGIEDIFRAALLEFRIEDPIAPAVWKKLAANCGINAVTALTGKLNIAVSADINALEVMTDAVTEVHSVANALGIDLGDREALCRWVREVAEKTGANRSSMGQDVDRKRITEIQFINGAVARHGKSLGMGTPVNQTLTNLVLALTAQNRQGDNDAKDHPP